MFVSLSYSYIQYSIKHLIFIFIYNKLIIKNTFICHIKYLSIIIIYYTYFDKVEIFHSSHSIKHVHGFFLSTSFNFFPSIFFFQNLFPIFCFLYLYFQLNCKMFSNQTLLYFLFSNYADMVNFSIT